MCTYSFTTSGSDGHQGSFSRSRRAILEVLRRVLGASRRECHVTLREDICEWLTLNIIVSSFNKGIVDIINGQVMSHTAGDTVFPILIRNILQLLRVSEESSACEDTSQLVRLHERKPTANIMCGRGSRNAHGGESQENIRIKGLHRYD